MKTKEELFSSITGLDSFAHSAAMLERIHDKGPSMVTATAPSNEDTPDTFKPMSYPFDYAWEKTQEEKLKLSNDVPDEGATQSLPLGAI